MTSKRKNLVSFIKIVTVLCFIAGEAEATEPRAFIVQGQHAGNYQDLEGRQIASLESACHQKAGQLLENPVLGSDVLGICARELKQPKKSIKIVRRRYDILNDVDDTRENILQARNNLKKECGGKLYGSVFHKKISIQIGLVAAICIP